MLNDKEARKLLDKLATKLGFTELDDELISSHPRTVDEFTVAVLKAEGLDIGSRSDIYKEVRGCVEDAFRMHLEEEENDVLMKNFFPR